MLLEKHVVTTLSTICGCTYIREKLIFDDDDDDDDIDGRNFFRVYHVLE